MKRLIFLNRFFFPDQSATSQILSDLAFYLAESGMDVHVITSRQLYENPKAGLPVREIVRGVTVHRAFSTQFGRTSLVGRAADYLTYFASTIWAAAKLVSAGDIIIAKTDPPLISVLAMWVARIRRATFVNWLQDIYPEIAKEMRLPVAGGLAGRCLVFLRDASLKKAAANIAVGEQMAAYLRSRDVSPDRVQVIPNWCNDEDIVSVSRLDNPLRKSWELQDKFVVGYSGNLGRGHEFDTLLAASEQFRENTHLIFVLIGGGYRFDELRRLVTEKSLDAIYRFFPYQDRKLLKYSLSVPDVHWISLQPAMSDFMFPSKFYGIAAVGRPILALTDTKGELARLVHDHNCGFAVETGDSAAMADMIALLAHDRALCEKMGLNARAMLDSKFTRRQALEHWKNLLSKLVAG